MGLREFSTLRAEHAQSEAPASIYTLRFGPTQKHNCNVKGGGQECPPYIGISWHPRLKRETWVIRTRLPYFKVKFAVAIDQFKIGAV